MDHANIPYDKKKWKGDKIKIWYFFEDVNAFLINEKFRRELVFYGVGATTSLAVSHVERQA